MSSEVKKYVKKNIDNARSMVQSVVSPTFNNKNVTKETPIYSWKLIMILGILLSLPFFGFFLYITPILHKRFPSKLFKNIYVVFLFGVFVNLLFGVYTISHFYYRLRQAGMKGPSGHTGKIGKKGKNTACDVDKVYHSTFTQDEKPIKRDITVELSLPNTLLLNEFGTKAGWNKIDGNVGIGRFLSPDGTRCLQHEDNGETTGKKCKYNDKKVIEDKNTKEITNQPFDGIIVDYNPTKGDIYSIQFLYNKKTNIHEKEDVQTFDERYGSITTKGTVLSTMCPPGAAFYKVEVLVSEDKEDGTYGGLKGISLRARNIKTGNIVKLLSHNGSYTDKVYFGIEPSPNHPEYRFLTAECGYVTDKSKILKIPGFFSGVNVLHSKEKINGFQFTQCSYFREMENPLLR